MKHCQNERFTFNNVECELAELLLNSLEVVKREENRVLLPDLTTSSAFCLM